MRDFLFEVMLLSLRKQESNNWQAFILGEEEAEEGNIRYFSSSGVSKTEKILEALRLIDKQNPPEYLIRLDDDDVIHPGALLKYEHAQADVIADKFHWFYNMYTDRFISNDYTWMANTVFHKYEHAIADSGNGMPVIAGDHSKVFHEWYTGKNIVYTSKKNPLYMRILSPTCLTLANVYQSDTVNYSFDDLNRQVKKIARWRRFGFWHPFGVKWFSPFRKLFRENRKKYF